MSNIKGEIVIKSNTGKAYRDLTKALNEISLDILNSATDALIEAEEDAALWAVQQLRATALPNSPSTSGNWRHYAMGWTYTAEGKRSKRFKVHNKTHYQLTHLLEKGHRIITHDGRHVGNAPAYPHIAPINDQVPDKVDEFFNIRAKEHGL